MEDAALLAGWRREEAEPFRGWDFSRIASRMEREHPPWSYEALAREALQGARRAVDLGTGGGEMLASLVASFPSLMIATEAYRPNVDVASSLLAPLGVHVVAYGADDEVSASSLVQDRAAALPFQDAAFDIVLDRHEAYDARDVARVLAPGGTFLTQQADGRSHANLLELFGTSPQWPGVTLENLVQELTGAGLEVGEASSWWGTLRFRDVGAVVYYLRAIPWLIPGFSVSRFEAVLLELQRELERAGELRFSEGRFIIRARKNSQAWTVYRP